MSWARLDDNFHDHGKVLGLSLEAVGLWTLCLTWAHHNVRTAAQPGHIPTAIVARFAGNKANRASAELVDAALWEVAGGGWAFHDFETYGAPARERSTPGTPPDLSAKRRAAGSKGGKRAQQKKQTPQATEQLAGEQSSNLLATPVVASNEATPVPVQSSTAAAVATTTLTQRSKILTDAYSTAVSGMCKWPAINAIVMKALRSERYTDDDISGALLRLAVERRSVTVDTLRVELDGQPPAPRHLRPVSTTDQRVGDTLALAEKYRQEGQ